MAPTTTGERLPEVLHTLRTAAPPGGRVLSAYLDTTPSRLAGQAYLLAFRDACKQVRAQLPPEEGPRFEAAVAQVERFLAQRLTPQRRGQALFAAGTDGYFYYLALPRPPADQVVWDACPALRPVEEQLDEEEWQAVLLFDKARACVVSIYLDAIEEEQQVTDEVPGKQATGGWFALAQKRYERHHEDHVLRHVKRAVAVVADLGRRRPFDRLFLAGPDEALALLRAHLPRPLRARLEGHLGLELFASDTQVLTAALRAAEEAERRDDLGRARELIDGAATPHAETGLDATLGR